MRAFHNLRGVGVKLEPLGSAFKRVDLVAQDVGGALQLSAHFKLLRERQIYGVVEIPGLFDLVARFAEQVDIRVILREREGTDAVG